MIVIMKDSKQTVLLDLKTSCAVSKTWPIQLAAYEHLCKLNGFGIDKVLIVHLKKNGTAQSISYPDLTTYWEIFDSSLTCYDYFNRKEGKNVCL